MEVKKETDTIKLIVDKVREFGDVPIDKKTFNKWKLDWKEGVYYEEFSFKTEHKLWS